MAEKLDRKARRHFSKEMARASFQLLKENKEFLKFPVISAVLTFLAVLVMGLPLFGMVVIFDNQLVQIVALFLFYLATSFITFLCNAALIHAVNQKLEGKDVTPKQAMEFAWLRRSAIFKWAIFNATVNTALRLIEERLGGLGRLVFGLVILVVGIAWNVVTFFALPAIIVEDIGFKESISRSRRLFAEVWGEQVGAGFRVGAVLVGGFLLCLLAVGALAVFAVAIHPVLAIIPAIAAIVLIIGFSFLNFAVSGVFQTVLYRYAVLREAPSGFDPEALQAAFTSRK